MPSYLKRTQAEIENEAIQKLLRDTPITSIGPGTVARALVGATSKIIGDMYESLDYNISQTLVSTATGSALDLLGTLYNVERKKISEVAAIDKRLGSFMFYIPSPFGSNITIPKGTNVYTDATTFIGQRFSFSTTSDTIIPTGRTRAFASIQPNFADTAYTAGANTLVIHDFTSPGGTTVYCTNPKAIAPDLAYETDDQYRIRIIKAIRVAAGGTLDAVRFAGLQQTGVREIRIRQAPYGMGSFEAVVIPERSVDTTEVIRRATEAMNFVRPLGVRMYIKTPTLLPLDISFALVTPGSGLTESNDTLVKRATIAVSRYINTLLPGSELVYNQLLQAIMDSSDLIKDVTISNFAINGIQVLRRNYKPADDEQIVFGSVVPSIAQA